MNAIDVIGGSEQWSVEQADALNWLVGLPEQSVDLCCFSPPYQQARLYLENGEDLGIGRLRKAQTRRKANGDLARDGANADLLLACERSMKLLLDRLDFADILDSEKWHIEELRQAIFKTRGD